jgi:hypothetical protein
MAMKAAILISGIVFGLFTLRVDAQTRLVFPEDPAGDEIRATAASFWNAVADGDRAKALSFCSDRVASIDFLDSSLSNVKASGELQKLIISRLGNSRDVQEISASAAYQREAKSARKSWFAMNGNCISMSTDVSLFNLGLELQNLGGKWLITRLKTQGPQFAPVNQEIVDLYVRTSIDCKAAIEDGALKNVDDLMKWRTRQLQLGRAAIYESAASKTTKPTDIKLEKSIASSTKLQGMLGHGIQSDDVVKLIASFPATPGLHVTPSKIEINSDATGIFMEFASDSRKLNLITLSGGDPAYLRYPDALPEGLSFTERRADVEVMLGKPFRSGGGGHTSYWAEYPDCGIRIDYRTPQLRDPDNSVANVTLVAAIPVHRLSTTRAISEGHELEFRLVVDNAKADDPSVEFLNFPASHTGKNTVAVSRVAIVTGSSIEQLKVSYGIDLDSNIAMTLSPEAGKVMHAFTLQHVHDSMAMVFDGTVLNVATINTPIGSELEISGSAETAAQTADLVGRMHAAIFTLPAAQSVK